jgi:hypothetical protein
MREYTSVGALGARGGLVPKVQPSAVDDDEGRTEEVAGLRDREWQDPFFTPDTGRLAGAQLSGAGSEVESDRPARAVAVKRLAGERRYRARGGSQRATCWRR